MTVLKEQLPEARDQRSPAKGPGPTRHQISEIEDQAYGSAADFCDPSTGNKQLSTGLRIALLTGGGDKPYALGMAAALSARGILMDFVGSDDLNVPELVHNPWVNFLNLRGSQIPQASRASKMLRVLRYYFRLIGYAAKAKPTLFHILWNNKVEIFDRTLLMLYYKLMGKSLALTAHNVNARSRDARDSFLNRLSLRIQYRLSDHIFVHSDRMKSQLVAEFGVVKDKVSVIPFAPR